MASVSLIQVATDPELVACILLLIVSRGWQATRLTKEDIEDAARVRCSGGGAQVWLGVWVWLGM